MRIAAIYLLVDQDTDTAASDYLSEALGNMPGLKDWCYIVPVTSGKLLDQEATLDYEPTRPYMEGEFLSVADDYLRENLERTRP